MKARNGAIVALLFLATCTGDFTASDLAGVESSTRDLGKLPASEVATWQKAGSGTTPDGRYLQAAAFDETRKVVVMFGGLVMNLGTGALAPTAETWEWSPATGKWSNRTGASAPPPRSGAAMVFDSVRGKMVMFGGRAGSGVDFEDTWEWDPTTGTWLDASAAGAHPSARSQHGMVYEKSTGKILLFGGGRSDPGSWTGNGMTISLGDTWEYDPATYAWAQRAVTVAPSVRHDLGLVWDGARGKAVLFGGMQVDIANATGVPKQDTWEWDPTAATWTERTAAGTKPSQRYGHAMAYDGSRKQVVLFGGWDISTSGTLADLWDYEPVTGVWTLRFKGNEAGLPSPRIYASMVSDDAGGRLEIVAGAAAYLGTGAGGSTGFGGTTGSAGFYGSGGLMILPVPVGGADAGVPGGPVGVPIGVDSGATGSREVWELNPATPAFTNRTPPLDMPASRYGQAMAFDPATGKTYLFGGGDPMTGGLYGDTWAWDGKAWALLATPTAPTPRSDAAMAYDPARKSLILFGGSYYGTAMADTWEWTSAEKWVQLSPAASPDPLMGHGMVTDAGRSKVLLFGGQTNYVYQPSGFYTDPMRNQVWEWDGLTATWTNRTPAVSVTGPGARTVPQMTFDEGRHKLFLFDGWNYGASPTSYWEWDPLTAGWASRDKAEPMINGYALAIAYDTLRRRQVMLASPFTSMTGAQETWELETGGQTWFDRQPNPSPGALNGPTAAFDSLRGVMVVFGGQYTPTGYAISETWEYKVTGWGNGEGCTAAFATSCASGNCVDGVCCDVAACTGACKSCNVPGAEGTCTAVKAGTEVAGSCAVGQACDGSGNCLTKNGQPCTAAAGCASGFCADGVCCDSACAGQCASCNQVGRAGACTPYAVGTDPQGECGQGSGVCKSTCDGVGSCAYPQYTVSCGNCLLCNGYGSCSQFDYNCGSGGYPIGGTGGIWINTGGVGGGPSTGYGGTSGRPIGGSTGTAVIGGSVGTTTGRAGATGTVATGGTGGYPVIDGNPVTGTSIKHSGCSCELGGKPSFGPTRAAPLLVAGLALACVRRRRRR
jgi:MYXO-CTERM domain-containing protein